MYGIKRGLYSNEAGVGSAPNAAASASVSHPVKQGLVQMLSVFIDTMIICTITAFVILSSNVELNGDVTGAPLVQNPSPPLPYCSSVSLPWLATSTTPR